MGPVTEKFVILEGKTVVDGEGVTRGQGHVLELAPEMDYVKQLVEGGFIAPVKELGPEDLEDFTVTEDFLAENPGMADSGIVVGDVIKVPKTEEKPLEDETATNDVVGDGAVEAAPAAEETPAEEVEVADEGPVMSYRGMRVISSTTREVNERELHHVRLEDGSEQDITDEEYEVMVNAAV